MEKDSGCLGMPLVLFALALGLWMAVGPVLNARAAGIATTAEYYSQVVAGSSPNRYCEFGDGASFTGPPSWTANSVDYVNPGSAGNCTANGSGTIGGSSTIGASSGTAPVGVTGGVLRGYRVQGSVTAGVHGAIGSNADAVAISARVNLNAIAGCSGGSSCRLYVITVEDDPGRLGVWSDDGFATMCFGVPSGVTHCSTYSGGVGAWVMITLIYHRSTGHVALYYNDHLSHDLDVGSTTVPSQGDVAFMVAWRNGQPWYSCAGGCWASGQNEVLSSVGVWEGAAADALDGPVNTGSNVTWVSALYNFLPVVAQPKGTVCTPNADGTHTCTVPLAPQAAPISGSVSKFQLGYLTLDTCVFPSDWTQISLYIPWLSCSIGNAFKSGINALLFAGNVVIDLLLPDGSGLQGFLDWWSNGGNTHGPLGYFTGTYNAIQAATSSASATQTWTIYATGSGGGSNLATYVVNFTNELDFMNVRVFLGWTSRQLAGAAVWLWFAVDLFNRVRTPKQLELGL